MRARIRAAAAALGLLIAAAGTRADGVAVLDRLEKAHRDLATAGADAGSRLAEVEADLAGPGLDAATKRALRKERSAILRAFKTAAKAGPHLDAAIAGLRGHNTGLFLSATKRAVPVLLDVERAFGPAYFPPATAEGLAATLGLTLAEARTVVDTSSSAHQALAEAADADGAKGAAEAARGRSDRAAAAFLSGMARLADLPMPVASGHQPVQMRALNGLPLNLALAVAPYSPKRTCGACHDYGRITEGYHFDQGRMAIRDDYAAGKPIPQYILSDGMYGRW